MAMFTLQAIFSKSLFQIVYDALISNAQGLALTDENGYFQAELNRIDNHLHVRKADFECSAELPRHSDDKKQVAFSRDSNLPLMSSATINWIECISFKPARKV